MASRRGGGESNVGLVVVLVFFILLSIGLGVATYFGFSQQDQLRSNEAKAKDAEKLANADRDWYRAQAWLYRSYLGKTKNLDPALVQQERQKFDENQFRQSKVAQAEDADVRGLVKEIEDKVYKVAKEDKNKQLAPADVTMRWDPNQKRPGTNYDELVADLLNRVKYQEEQTAAALKAKADAERERDEAKTALAQAKKDFDAQVARLTDDNKKLQNQQQDELKAVVEKNNGLQQNLTEQQTKFDALLKEEQKKSKDLETEVANQKQRVEDVQRKLDLAAQKTTDRPVSGEPIKPDYYVTRMDDTGKRPTVNVGSADNVRPQLRFSIHGIGPDGKPLAESKGSLEIVSVLGPHQSQAEITSVKPDKDGVVRNPVVKGDVIYNGVWSPTAERHVAVAGAIHLRGEKRDSLDEFLRLLQRQGVVVDAYLDPQDGTIKKEGGQAGGRITPRTDYLILGDELDEAKDVKLANLKELQEAARNDGVRIISLREFLDSTGYRTP
jgi:hypothetical protein